MRRSFSVLTLGAHNLQVAKDWCSDGVCSVNLFVGKAIRAYPARVLRPVHSGIEYTTSASGDSLCFGSGIKHTVTHSERIRIVGHSAKTTRSLSVCVSSVAADIARTRLGAVRERKRGT